MKRAQLNIRIALFAALGVFNLSVLAFAALPIFPELAAGGQQIILAEALVIVIGVLSNLGLLVRVLPGPYLWGERWAYLSVSFFSVYTLFTWWHVAAGEIDNISLSFFLTLWLLSGFFGGVAGHLSDGGVRFDNE